LSATGLRNVVQADLTALSFGDGSFDGVPVVRSVLRVVLECSRQAVAKRHRSVPPQFEGDLAEVTVVVADVDGVSSAGKRTSS